MVAFWYTRHMQPAPKRHVGWLIFTLMFLLVVAAGLWQRYWIYDEIRLWNYQPPAAIRQLADETTMDASTRRVFYANHPALEDKTQFSQHCTSGEKTIVLGCYINTKGIYLYQVTDSRLHGIIEVTAAHETLHAEYERLSPADKKRVDTMINNAYAQITDKRIRETIQSYQDAGADVTNELHSILGTEVRTLPTDLENYYKRYFTNRAAIVAYSEQYEGEFSSRQQQVAADDAKLKELKTQIDQQNAQLEQQANSINATYKQLQALRSSGQTEQYNAGVPGYNNSIANYNAKVRNVQSLINAYNQLVNDRNKLALEENQLIQAIDSRPTTLESQ